MEEALDEVERQLGIRLCPAMRVLYRVHDGQELEFDRQVGACWLGLEGEAGRLECGGSLAEGDSAGGWSVRT